MIRYVIEKGIGGWFVRDTSGQQQPYGPIKRKSDAERECRDLNRKHRFMRSVDDLQQQYAEFDDELPTVPSSTCKALTTRGECPHSDVADVTENVTILIDGEWIKQIRKCRRCQECGKLRP